MADTIPPWVRQLPQEKISRKAFDGLPEYSLSSPTGAVAGKVWKHNLCFGADQPFWLICEYVNHPTNPELLRTDCRRPLIEE